MKYSLGILYLFILFKFAKSVPDGYITGGAFAQYNLYPHSVFLNIACEQHFMCGGSILNQDIVLTAAHCTQGCERVDSRNIQVKYGHELLSEMKTTYVQNYKQHQHYDDEFMVNDICLLSVAKRIPLRKAVKRVILMKYPPSTKYAFVAGWGLDEHKESQQKLKHTSAMIQKLDVCQNMGWMPKGAFCAGPVTGIGTAEQGDSGGALVIQKYIQVGIVSFNVERYSLVAYTNTSYHFDWIQSNARKLVC